MPRRSWIAALLFVVGGLVPSARTWGESLSVEVTVSPRVQKGRISPYVFGAGIDHKTNPLRYPKYPDKVLRDIGESGLRIARYPGRFVFNRNEHRGSWANFYWQDHIGKNRDRRPTEVYDRPTAGTERTSSWARTMSGSISTVGERSSASVMRSSTD